MEKLLQITKAPIAKIWNDIKAKAIAALEKCVSVSTFEHMLPYKYRYLFTYQGKMPKYSELSPL